MQNSLGAEMYGLLSRLFPICRSITGNGVRETLSIIGKHIPIVTHEVPTGTKVFDWTVPKEWNIIDGFVADESGHKIIDFKSNNLHVVGYSSPVDKVVGLKELLEHLYTIPEQVDAIPYVTSYYQENWGFCMRHRDISALTDQQYHVFIDSELIEGSLTYGEMVIKGNSTKEVFFSTYVCHPSMANNELSGPVVLTQLAKWLETEPRYYTYRLVFIPETIGSITYLSKHLEWLKDNVVAAFNMTCMGDDDTFSLMPSRNGKTITDRVASNVLRDHYPGFIKYSFLDRASDERQYCSPGVDLPMVSIMRTKYGEYPEYHTSMDNLDFVTEGGLLGSYEVHRKCIEALENNKIYEVLSLGEPQLSKRGLYPDISIKNGANHVKVLLDVLAYCDGTNDLIDLSDTIGISLEELYPIIAKLALAGLVKANDR
tara:strand:+ start:5997 stop:7280 length:1284 start_codon:yes stop_codon:yes gene_type:complete